MSITETEVEAGKVIIRILSKAVLKRKFYDYALLEDMLREIKYFQECRLTTEELTQISKDLLLCHAKARETVFDYRSTGTDLYIILMGRVSVQVPSRKNPADYKSKVRFEEVAQLEIGCSFGELACIIGLRSAKIVSLEEAYFAVVPNYSFRSILKQKNEKRLNKTIIFLLNTPYFKNCRLKNLYLVQYYFQERECIKGQMLCSLGDPASNVYLVIDGEFEQKMTINKKTAKELNESKKCKKIPPRKGAIALGRMLRVGSSGELLDLTKKINTFKNIGPTDDLMEISLKRIGSGELFGHEDVLKDREKYTSTVRCISLKALVYQISTKNFNKWIRNMTGLSTFMESEIPNSELRTNNYLKLCHKIKTGKIPKLRRSNQSLINIKSPNSRKDQNSFNSQNRSKIEVISTPSKSSNKLQFKAFSPISPKPTQNDERCIKIMNINTSDTDSRMSESALKLPSNKSELDLDPKITNYSTPKADESSSLIYSYKITPNTSWTAAKIEYEKPLFTRVNKIMEFRKEDLKIKLEKKIIESESNICTSYIRNMGKEIENRGIIIDVGIDKDQGVISLPGSLRHAQNSSVVRNLNLTSTLTSKSGKTQGNRSKTKSDFCKPIRQHIIQSLRNDSMSNLLSKTIQTSLGNQKQIYSGVNKQSNISHSSKRDLHCSSMPLLEPNLSTNEINKLKKIHSTKHIYTNISQAEGDVINVENRIETPIQNIFNGNIAKENSLNNSTKNSMNSYSNRKSLGKVQFRAPKPTGGEIMGGGFVKSAQNSPVHLFNENISNKFPNRTEKKLQFTNGTLIKRLSYHRNRKMKSQNNSPITIIENFQEGKINKKLNFLSEKKKKYIGLHYGKDRRQNPS